MTGEVIHEYQIVGFPGCDDYHPQTANQARDIVDRKKRDHLKAADSYEAAGNLSMAYEMRRRAKYTGYETRTITEWEAGK